MEYPAHNIKEEQYTLQKVNYPEYIEEIGRLRYLAWKDVEGINKDFFSKGYWIDEYDKSSLLWIIKSGNTIAASARLSIHHTIETIPWKNSIPPGAADFILTPVASMNRLTVHPDFRRRGLSKQLDLVRIQAAREEKVKTIIAEPTKSRVSVIEKYGFKDFGRFGDTPELPGVALAFKVLNL